jgi:hypothetical protein
MKQFYKDSLIFFAIIMLGMIALTVVEKSCT